MKVEENEEELKLNRKQTGHKQDTNRTQTPLAHFDI
jgi:hypothetical protein